MFFKISKMDTLKHKETELFYIQLQERSNGLSQAGMLTSNIFLEVGLQWKKIF